MSADGRDTLPRVSSPKFGSYKLRSSITHVDPHGPGQHSDYASSSYARNEQAALPQLGLVRTEQELRGEGHRRERYAPSTMSAVSAVVAEAVASSVPTVRAANGLVMNAAMTLTMTRASRWAASSRAPPSLSCKV